MKLIKINTDHYVVVDDSQIKDGDWYYDFIYNKIDKCNLYIGKHDTCKKITHSTQPLGIGWQQEVIELSLQEVKELIGEVDVEKKALAFAEAESYGKLNGDLWKGFLFGYNQALADNKGKKYTEEDVISIVKKSRETGLTAEYLLLSIQLKTEWEVQIVDGKLKLKL